MGDKPPAEPKLEPRESDEARRRIIEDYAAGLRELISELMRKLRQKLHS